jgi:hypothetical protein
MVQTPIFSRKNINNASIFGFFTAKSCKSRKIVVPLPPKSDPLDDSQDRHSVSYGAAAGGMCAAGRG